MASAEQEVESLRLENAKMAARLDEARDSRDRLAIKHVLDAKTRKDTAHTLPLTIHADAAAAAEIQALRDELKTARAQADAANEKLHAAAFSRTSVLGRRLIQKCEELHAENEQLAREVSDGRIDKLRAEASAAGASAAGLKRKLVEAREWADSLLDELEAAQHVIGSLRRELGGASEQQHGQRGGGGSAHNKRARH